jgi:YfiH family protein
LVRASAGVPFRPETAQALVPAGLDLGRVAWARQVHGAGVARVATSGFAGVADVLVTAEPRVALAIFTADCLAVALYDPAARALALAHVGWRGTVGGATQAAVSALAGLGARAERLRGAIGPSIGPCCYEVDEPVIAAFSDAYPGTWERWVTPRRPGHWMLDLWRANEELLAGSGIGADRVDNPRLCTACHPELLYSYRRGIHGRLATLAALP